MANIELRRRYPRDIFGIEPYLDRLFDLDTSLWDLPVTSFPIDVIENDMSIWCGQVWQGLILNS